MVPAEDVEAVLDALVRARDRAARQIAKENEAILKRLKMLKPNYSTKKFALGRQREEKVLWLRHTDHTV